MIIPSGDRNVERISLGEAAETKYTIKATGKAFKILSSGLYKDKILAIIREISCNAYDAHVSIGKKDVPFEVKLPNAIEPFLSIRDKGPSLNPDALLNVFSRYFESTKTETNDQIGGFGLGSKTPFSYVDSYTVIARLDGIKRTYTCFYDEKDTPTIALMGEEETDEETGLEVIVPVKSYDFRAFREKAEQIYTYFNPAPIVIGDAEYALPERTPLIVGRGYKVYNEKNNYYTRKTAKAVMGIVAYPIDSSLIDEMTGSERSFLSLPIDIEFNIGEIEVTAGREEISYTAATKKAIASRTREVMADVARRVYLMFKECKTEFEARVLWYKLYSVSGEQLFSGFKDKAVPFKGITINSNTFEVPMAAEYPGLRILHYRQHGYRKTLTRHDVLDGHSFGSASGAKVLGITAHENLTFIIDDDNGKHLSNKVKCYREENGGATVMVLRNTEIPVPPVLPGDESPAPEPVQDDTDYVEKFTKLFSGAKFLNLSELEREEPQPRTPTQVKMIGEYGKSVSSFARHHLATIYMTDEVMDGGGVYIKTISGAYQWDDQSISSGDLESVYKRAKALGVIPKEANIYIVPKTLCGSFEKADNWTTLYDLVKDYMEGIVDDKTWFEKMKNTHCTEKFMLQNYSYGGAMPFTKQVKSLLTEEHPLAEILSTWINTETQSETYSQQVYLADKVGIEIDLDIQETIDDWNRVIDSYPLMNLIFKNIRYEAHHAVAQQLVEYVSAIDNLKLQNIDQ